MRSSSTFDVIILGSGFGASLLSTILSRGGLSVAMIDRDSHPRFAIGESSTPAADLILRTLATRYQLNELLPLCQFGSWQQTYPELSCGCKRGFSYFWHGDGDEFRASPEHQHELLVAANSSRDVADTQWYRPSLDHFLAKVAQQSGVVLHEQTQINEITRSDSRQRIVTTTQAGQVNRWQAEFLIDATGPAGELIRRLGLRSLTKQLQTCSSAIYSHWENVRSIDNWLESQQANVSDYPYPCRDSVIHHLFRDGWLWQIGFENGLSSVGFVAPSADRWSREPTADEAWTALRRGLPTIDSLLGTSRLAAFPGRVYRTGRLQRLWSEASGTNWAALPFTVGFIDPLHSTGIAHTLIGVERLARILLEYSGRSREQELANYSRQTVSELLHIDRLVSGCYLGLQNFELFTAWSMLYFAAATCFEKQWLRKPAGSIKFLCPDNDFEQLVCHLKDELQKLAADGPIDARHVTRFTSKIRDQLKPYDHVGLFSPEVPNMYRYTAAEK